LTINEFLDDSVREAKWLLSQREGIHNLHGAVGSIQIMRSLVVELGKYAGKEQLVRDWVNTVLETMRIAVNTGVYCSQKDKLTQIGNELFRSKNASKKQN
jgi:hypothetical protein